MARILGVEIPDNKKIEISLTYIYGIGKPTAKKILSDTGVSPEKRVKELTDEELSKITNYIQRNFKVEGDLKKEISENIRRLVEINSYRGFRHKRSLPVRGQRTRTNARTRKGPRKTVGIVRDKTARKAMRQEKGKEE
ncbi:MAG TPA: 30S ribosomal protein S13 [Candidatus Ratteibacteria bacterium]|nr:30S ribosomal protein S13 [bacterium]HRR95664.1 30S ribosomal protein S13 [Candidatus Ratteibacteria bacterium]